MYDLAVEIDEHGHQDRDPLYERKRQKFIEKQLGCTFIRINPDCQDFNILDIVNKIFSHIKSSFS